MATDLEEEFEESRMVAEAMKKYGGSFVEALGRAIVYADPANTQIIKDNWPAYWEHYLKIARGEKVG